MKIKFEVNEIYTWPGLFGPSWEVRCVARTEDTVTFKEIGYEKYEGDTLEIEIESCEEQEIERCVCYEYFGEIGYIKANR